MLLFHSLGQGGVGLGLLLHGLSQFILSLLSLLFKFFLSVAQILFQHGDLVGEEALVGDSLDLVTLHQLFEAHHYQVGACLGDVAVLVCIGYLF